MGKASRAKKNRPRRDRADLLELVDENRRFLRASADAFDRGFEAEAKRLAVTLRVLLHDTRTSHSLVGQLGVKDRLEFLDTAAPIKPWNMLPTPGLIMMKMTGTEEGSWKGEYIAPLDMPRPTPPRLVPFSSWWQNPVMKVDGTWSRKQLVLGLAHKEGGAHVDPSLDERYEALAKRNAIGATTEFRQQVKPFAGNAVALGVRQITYEVLETLERERRLLT